MAINYNPRLVTDGLVLCLDAANRKSYSLPKWSTGWSNSPTSPANSFDGNLTTASRVGAAGIATYTFSGGLKVLRSARVYVDLGATIAQVGGATNIILINGIDITSKLKTNGFYLPPGGWIDVTTEVGGTFNTITLTGTTNVANPGLYAVEVDGQILIDGYGTTWTDLSGNGNNGALQNGVGYVGTNGGALTFDGTNDYVTIPRNANIIPTGDWTYECWFNLTTTTDPNYGQSFFGNWGTYATHDFDIRKSGNYIVFLCNDVGNNPIFTISAPYTFVAQQWTYFSLIRQSNTYNFYFNSQLAGSVTNSNPVFNGTSNMTIGVESGGSSRFSGRMSNVRIYNRALSAAEILQNYNATKSRYGL